ncbi:MAG: tRNA-intron lyase [Candidatus Aenigmatarchaeota archaeon]
MDRENDTNLKHEKIKEKKFYYGEKPKLILDKDNKIFAFDNNSARILKESFFGIEKDNRLELNPIEALYLVNIRKISCFKDEKQLDFLDLLKIFSNVKRIFAKYNVYRDWRDRGIIPSFIDRIEEKNFERSPSISYPSRSFTLPKLGKELIYIEEDAISLIKADENVEKLFEDFWFGQLGVYKQHTRDKFLKLDFIETLFLVKHGYVARSMKTGKELSFESLLKKIKKQERNVEALLDVYEDWRLRGYIIKTGFKFGTHFRLYFPGASPIKEKSKWIHSKHVIHVFPKEVRMRMSEWARAVRVAHSVRKTFIMAIPGMKEEEYEKGEIDFIGYHRKKIGIEKPNEDSPKFAIIAFTEDEKLGGKELACALRRADDLGLRLIIAISDRETSVTYYVAKRISLPGSKNTYYEIEWEQP